MSEYYQDIEKAHNITEIREILYYIRKKYAKPLASVVDLLELSKSRIHDTDFELSE